MKSKKGLAVRTLVLLLIGVFVFIAISTMSGGVFNFWYKVTGKDCKFDQNQGSECMLVDDYCSGQNMKLLKDMPCDPKDWLDWVNKDYDYFIDMYSGQDIPPFNENGIGEKNPSNVKKVAEALCPSKTSGGNKRKQCNCCLEEGVGILG